MHWKHWVGLGLVAGLWVAYGLWPDQVKAFEGILVVALPVVWQWLGMTSPKLPPIFGSKGPPTGLSGTILCLALAGCLKAVPVIGPVVACVSTVVADALKGMTLDQILADAGPQCVQSVDQVIAILVGEAGRNPMVKETAAYRDQRTGAWLRAAQP